MPRPIYLLVVLVLVCAATLRSADEPGSADERLRGSRFEWVRLQTNNGYWNRHGEADGELLNYLRRTTTLDIGPTPRSARATMIEDLSLYPFVYCENLADLSSLEAKNLAEYLRRGGFLFIDACQDSGVNPSLPWFLKAQLKVLSDQFPDLRTEELVPAHEVYSIYFKMTQFPPGGKQGGYPLRLVFSGDRAIAIISLNGLQCTWSGKRLVESAANCAQMIANIYVYAMTR